MAPYKRAKKSGRSARSPSPSTDRVLVAQGALAMRVPVPPDVRWTREQVEYVLGRLGLETWDSSALELAAELARDVRHGDRPGRFEVAGIEVRAQRDDRIAADDLEASQVSWSERCCPYTGAVLLALAWSDPACRPWFALSGWRIALAAFQVAPADVRNDAPAPVSWELDCGAPGCVPGPDELLRADGPLQTPDDRRVGAFLTRARALAAAGEPALAAEELAGALAALASCTVRHGGRPLRVQRTPVPVHLRGTHDPDGNLALSLSPALDAMVGLGPGYVVTSDGMLAPLPEHYAATDAWRVAALPTIPRADIDAFFLTVYPGLTLPVALDSGPWTPVAADGPPTPELLLSLTGEVLELKARFRYHWQGHSAVTRATDPRPVVVETNPGGRRLSRDTASERAALTMLARCFDAGIPERLDGDDALDFLLDGLPTLSNWTILGEDALKRAARLRRARPTVRVARAIDWFDVSVTFQTDAGAIAAAAALADWSQGRRFHTLASGEIARLPDAWLRRYGRPLARVEALRTDTTRVSALALPAARPLLEADESADAPRWLERSRQLERLDGVPEVDVPAALQATLRPYQRAGLRWLAFLRQLGLPACLADDMGLGKTVQTLALLLHVRADRPALVVAPTSAVDVWAEQARRFAPTLTCRVHRGRDRQPLTAKALEPVDLVITSYALLRQERQALTSHSWSTVVLDEAQNIKNPDCATARAAFMLRADQRIALTGTPVENHLLELWSLFHFLEPGLLGSRAGFLRETVRPVETGGGRDALESLRQRVRPLVLRRLRSEVARDLPPLEEIVVRCEMGTAQRRLYESVKELYRAPLLSQGAPRSMDVLEALTRLRQVCCSPRLLPVHDLDARSIKLERLSELLAEARTGGHRSLVFSQWPSLLKLAAERLDIDGVDYLMLDGTTRDRATLVERFNAADGPPVFLVSLHAGGTGITLTGADHVVHLDPWWNPAAEAQATARAHRIGQTRPVVVHRLICSGSVEEKIIELQEHKRWIAESTIDTDRLMTRNFTREQLAELLAPLPGFDDGLVHLERAHQTHNLPPIMRDRLESRPTGVSNAEVRRLLGCTAPRARQLLKGWVDAGLLQQLGERRGTRYRLANAGG